MPLDVNGYAAAYAADYGFERYMVAARQRHLSEQLAILQPKTVLEVGCGQELLLDALSTCSAMTWWIVEPAQAFAEKARSAMARHPQLQVEETTLEVWDDPSFQAELVIISSLLHEVPDPVALVQAAKARVAPGGALLVNVPNALSLHRQLAQAMGLLEDVTQLTARNQQLGQPRVFTLASLKQLLIDNGLVCVAEGGYMLKPFTHAQMEACVPLLPTNAMAGLYQLGEMYPELASEVWVLAQ